MNPANMFIPLDAEKAQGALEKKQKIHLHPNWRPPESKWLKLLFQGRRHLPTIAYLQLDEQILTLTMDVPKLPPISVDLNKPLDVILTRRACRAPQHTEIQLAIREQNTSSETHWIQLRTVWPTPMLEEGIPESISFAPFMDPEVFILLAKSLLFISSNTIDPLDLSLSEKLSKTLHSDGIASSCESCHSLDLAAPALQAYRCLQCSHEGGPGLPEWLKARG